MKEVMIPFEKEIMGALTEAMKAKDQVRLDVLRGMKSALQYKLIEKEQQPITEQEAFAVFESMIKKRQEAATQYEQFNRLDRANKEKREIEIIRSFLPAQLSEVEIIRLIQETIQMTQASSPKDMGKVMKELKPKITGRADAKQVANLVQKTLASPT